MSQREPSSATCDYPDFPGEEGLSLVQKLTLRIKAVADAEDLPYDGEDESSKRWKACSEAGIHLDDFVMVHGRELIQALTATSTLPSADRRVRLTCEKCWKPQACLATNFCGNAAQENNPHSVTPSSSTTASLTDEQIMNAAIKAADELDATRVSEMRDGGWHSTTIFDGDTGLLRFGRLVEKLCIASATARATADSIYCEGCGEIRPLVMDEMPGKDVSGKFSRPTDMMCGDCKLVIATTYLKDADGG